MAEAEAEAERGLLTADEARIAIDGAVVIDRLTFVAGGDRVILAGDPGALVAALTGVPLSAIGGGRASASDDEVVMPGEAAVVAGSLRLAGLDVATGAHLKAMGAAPLDPPLPPGWTALEYVTWSARLAGIGSRHAEEIALAALHRVGLQPARKKHLAALTLPEKRALLLAHAVVTSPAILIAEAPLSGLEGDAAAAVLAALVAVTEGRRAVVSVSRLDPSTAEGSLARGGSHVVVLAAGEVALEGTPAEAFSGAKLFSLTVHTNAEPLRNELAARGIDLRGGPRRFSASLPPGAGSHEILLAASAARAAMVELVPLFG